MNSRPLFMSVAESTEILRPITQFGCAQASSGVTARERARSVSRNGPPDAVSRMRLHAGRRNAGHARRAADTGTPRCARCRWAAACARAARTVCMSSGPAMTSDSLLASSRRLPARAAASVERSPAAPTMAAMTLSTSGSAAISSSASAPASTRVRAPRARSCSSSLRAAVASASAANGARRTALPAAASFSALRCAPSATTRNRSGMTRDHVERGFADRSGRTEDGDADHGMTCSAMSANTSAGAAAVTLSMRSSMPPWPGNTLPLSLRPTARLNMLSVRSPDDGNGGDREYRAARTARRPQ